MKVKINLIREPKLEEAVLVSGFPGIAYVGKLSVDYLIQELKAELIGEIHSHFFSPYVLIKNGIVELLRNELYYLEKNAEKGVLFLTGNAQAASPEGQYIVADKILDEAIKFGVKKVYSIAAYLSSKPFKEPKVYGTATNLALLEDIKEYGVTPMDQGTISGMNGLIFGLARTKKLKGVCLLGETRGYRTATGRYLVDARAVRAILDVLKEMLDIKLNMEPLKKQAEEVDRLIMQMTEMERRAMEEIQDTAEKGRTRYIT